MRVLETTDVLAIAAEVLGCSAVAVVDTTDIDAVDRAVEQAAHAAADDEDSVAVATALLSGLVRRRPFARSNRRIAVLAAVQSALLNGCDLELPPVGELDELLDAVTAGTVSDDELARRLRGRSRRGNPRLEVRMFERFTDDARSVVTLAQDEARGFSHSYVGTEHVLLGLIREGKSVAARTLSDAGLRLEQVREAVQEVVGTGTSGWREQLPFTPRTKKVLELSLREARHLGHNYIAPQHILLGLIREGDGLGAQLLQKFDVDLATIRRRVVSVLDVREDGIDVNPASVPPQDDVVNVGKSSAVLEENDRLRAEVARLRALLRDHGIDPDA
jgi:prophage maintenance system killer protein